MNKRYSSATTGVGERSVGQLLKTDFGKKSRENAMNQHALVESVDKEIRHKTSTKKLSLDLTIEELGVLLPLASDQLFRNEFIDIRIPGFEQNREKVQSAKAVISRIKERLREVQQQQSPGSMRLSIRYP